MNERIATLLNDQINKEFYSAYLYLDMANYYDDLNLDGYANYYMIQAQEERDHALLFMKYIQAILWVLKILTPIFFMLYLASVSSKPS